MDILILRASTRLVMVQWLAIRWDGETLRGNTALELGPDYEKLPRERPASTARREGGQCPTMATRIFAWVHRPRRSPQRAHLKADPYCPESNELEANSPSWVAFGKFDDGKP